MFIVEFDLDPSREPYNDRSLFNVEQVSLKMSVYLCWGDLSCL